MLLSAVKTCEVMICMFCRCKCLSLLVSSSPLRLLNPRTLGCKDFKVVIFLYHKGMCMDAKVKAARV